MAKNTAIVDLGSNSIRMVIFQKTSRYAFFTTQEYKRRVRLGENAYNNGKFLQPSPMRRAEEALAFFKEKAREHKCKKMIIIGTSALRDAPNSKDFIKRIKNNLGLNIRCIDGKTEAFLGGLAALNLLSPFENATTLDIGGGSSELCLIKNHKIISCISLNIGTVRLKELFYDKGKKEKIDEFINEIIVQIPADFKNEKLIAIGGSLRALSNSIMKKNSYPLKILHDFCYDLDTEKEHISKILNTQDENLSDFGVKKERFDTIKEGLLIFTKIAEFLGTKKIITSGVGIREGVYLQDLLRPKMRFPVNFNPSLRSLQDRFLPEIEKKTAKFASELFEILAPLHKLDLHFKILLINSAKLCRIGERLDFYFANEHSAYLVLGGLHYGFSHSDKILISTLIRLNGKKISPILTELYGALLPDLNTLLWLNFLLALAKNLSINEQKVNFSLKNDTLYISGENKFDLDFIKKIAKPNDLNLFFNQKS